MIDSRRIYLVSADGGIQQADDYCAIHNQGLCLVYWMTRDQRIQDNWGLLSAQYSALQHKLPLVIVCTIVPNCFEVSLRQYSFMLDGLKEIQQKAHTLHIPFFSILSDEPSISISTFAQQYKAAAIFTDFDPLAQSVFNRVEVASRVECPVYEVDSHNIVPARFISQKVEFGAYTLRPKIKRVLNEFLVDIPSPIDHPFPFLHDSPHTDFDAIQSQLKVNSDIQPVLGISGGEYHAQEAFSLFVKNTLSTYHLRNDPNAKAVSGLSPWLHVGNISSQRIAYEVKDIQSEQSLSFLEELIVRKELADNYCLYADSYTDSKGFPNWAKTTHSIHSHDKREYLYTLEQFKNAETHDDLWNAAQCELVYTGRMHGYMRMYWAKKILEWTHSPEEAQSIAIYLNDAYQLDGRDPNGYTGIAWSIGGVHDRAWFERPIFGKIRYMNANGCKSKFDTKLYIKHHLHSQQNANTLF